MSLTRAAGPSAATVWAYKSASQSVTSSTTVVDDTHLQLSLPVGTWALDGFLPYDGATTGDLSIRWTAPATITSDQGIMFQGPPNTASANNNTLMHVCTPKDTSVSRGCIGASSTSTCVLTVRGELVVTEAGTFKLQWAQTVSDATATRVHKGAWLRATRVA